MLYLSWVKPVPAISPQPLDALDHCCHRVDEDPAFARKFYASATPEEMVALALEIGIFIDADDFRALLRSGSSEFWLLRGSEASNPIIRLVRVFSS